MQEQIDRVETWANTLKAGQAPHQQQLADDALVLVSHAKGTLAQPDNGEPPDVGQAVATVPRDTFDRLAQERDDLQSQFDNARKNITDLIDDKTVLDNRVAELIDEKTALEAQLADLTSQLDAATTPLAPPPPQPDDVVKQDRA